MSKRKNTDDPPPPGPRLQDMSLSDVSKYQLDAIEKGDTKPLVDLLKRSVDPEPKPEPPTHYLVTLPLVERDGIPSVGAVIQLSYPGVGTDLELRLPSGENYKVSLLRLSGVIDALRTAMLSSPPPPGMMGRPYVIR